MRYNLSANYRIDPVLQVRFVFLKMSDKDVIDMPTMASGNKNKNKLMEAKYLMKYQLNSKL